MTQLPKTIMLDLTHQTLLTTVKELQAQRNINNSEMELILIKVLNDVKTSKESDYAEAILDLVYQLQQKEQEQQAEEPEMTPIVPEGENQSDEPINMKINEIAFTPDEIEVNPEQE